MIKIKKYICVLVTISFLILSFTSSNILEFAHSHNDLFINEIASVEGSGYDVWIQNNFAYVTNNDGVDIINVEDPTNPAIISRLEITDGAFGIYIQEDIAYIAAAGSGFKIANISDPLNPILLSQSSGHGIARRVFVKENFAYLACYENGLKIFDITTTTDPVKIGEYIESGRIDGVVCKDEIMFLANPNLGIEIINITNHNDPVRISTLNTISGVHDLFIYNSLLFAGCYDSSVWVINITIPSIPVIIGNHADYDGGEAQGVKGNSTHIFVADNSGVEIKSINNLPIITEITEIREGIGAAHDIDYVDNYIFVAGGGINKNLRIFEVSSEQTTNETKLPISIMIFSIFSISLLFSLKSTKKKYR